MKYFLSLAQILSIFINISIENVIIVKTLDQSTFYIKCIKKNFNKQFLRYFQYCK